MKKLREVGNVRMPLLALLFLLLISNSFAAIVNECRVDNLWNDWRTVAVGAMLVTVGFISILYMYGSALDNSYVARAKNEMFQLIATAVLVLAFMGIVQFMCSSAIPEAFEFEGESMYGAGRAYLENLSGYVLRNFGVLLTTQMVLTGAGSVKTKIWGSKSISKGIFASAKFLNEALGLSVFTNMTAYLVTITQLSLLDYVRLVSVTVFLPAGIVLRGFYPFRNFGGALIGTAIALYVMVPVLLMLNKVMMDPVLGEQVIGENRCTEDKECYSQKCSGISREVTGVGDRDPVIITGKCATLKAHTDPPEEKTCSKDRECLYGYCVDGVCADCGGFDEAPVEGRCCKGMMPNAAGTKCIIAKKVGETCTYPNHRECISEYCSPGGRCEKKKATDIPNCNEDAECWYGSCAETVEGKKCKQTILSPADVYLVRGRDQGVYDVTKTYYDAKPLTLDKPGEEVSIFESFVNTFAGGIIGGIMLPALNLVIISAAIRSFSSFFGSEINLEKLWKVI